MTFRRFFAYFTVCLALFCAAAWPFRIPQSMYNLGQAVIRAEARQADELVKTKAALAAKDKELEAMKAKAPEAQASAGGS
jgi:hypothetical protein